MKLNHPVEISLLSSQPLFQIIMKLLLMDHQVIVMRDHLRILPVFVRIVVEKVIDHRIMNMLPPIMLIIILKIIPVLSVTVNMIIITIGVPLANAYRLNPISGLNNRVLGR